MAAFVTAATAAAGAIDFDEADTRKLIDEQLRDAGWTADSAPFSFPKGARPEKGKNLAIAEWPTSSGPADYVLFVGLMPIAVVEVKRKNVDVSSALQQATRYGRPFNAESGLLSPGGLWSEFRIPFAFSSNGRPYLRQLATRSGTWFCDLRRPDNLGRALDGWYTPEGLDGDRHSDGEPAQLHGDGYDKHRGDAPASTAASTPSAARASPPSSTATGTASSTAMRAKPGHDAHATPFLVGGDCRWGVCTQRKDLPRRLIQGREDGRV